MIRRFHERIETTFNAVYSFFTLGSARKRFEDTRNLVEEGFIIYSDLWALYKPGDLVVSKDPVGNYELAQVTSVKWEEDIWTSIQRNRLVHYNRADGLFCRKVPEGLKTATCRGVRWPHADQRARFLSLVTLPEHGGVESSRSPTW